MARIIRAEDSADSHARAMELTDIALDAREILEAARIKAARVLAEARASGDAERAKGMAEGRAAGHAEGRAAGLAEGRAAAEREGRAAAQAETRTLVTLLTAVLADLETRKHALVNGARQDLLELALRTAGVVVDREIARGPQAVDRAILRAIELVSTKSDLEIRLNPADAEAVERVAPELARRWRECTSVRAVPDPAVARGGCIVRTRDGEVDAQVATAFEEIRRALLVE